jgi:hypothetical protein
VPLIEGVLRRRIDAKLDQLAAYRHYITETANNLAELVTVSMT